ncbi:S41 family peptidase [Lentzea sp. NBRC 102530]|uniref:S41 family peptidase n=1 Tax=Lentzea sp. NBRC 102530 TaxID=3032201 RepID=UPI0024A5B243|nr:S41 family peptidase [Lentzea sp. NBRC 102530]GLY52517.1 peptidase S41 [Lentzea sp. NBRC 102530]
MRPEECAYVDSALDLLQRHSIESAHAVWPALRAQAHAAENAHEAVRHAIAALGNPHTHLITAERAASPPPVVPTGQLTGTTAVVRLPEIHASHGRTYVSRGLRLMRALVAAEPAGWVVDLRGNRGGAMHPMLTVVAPLLGEGECGRFVGPHGETGWGIRRRHLCSGGRRSYRLHRVPRSRPGPVALLVDGRTASSGEAVLVSFLGVPGVKTFGAPTAGFATANQTYRLKDGARLAITTAVMADRTGRTYGNAPIAPHVSTDDALTKAIEWIEAGA